MPSKSTAGCWALATMLAGVFLAGACCIGAIVMGALAALENPEQLAHTDMFPAKDGEKIAKGAEPINKDLVPIVKDGAEGVKEKEEAIELPGKDAPLKPEPAKPEPIKPEPIKPEPVKPEPAKPEPAKPEPAKPEPAKPEPAKPEPAKPKGPDGPVAVLFDDKGVFTMQAMLDPNHPDPGVKGRTCRCFRFRAQANVAYTVASPQPVISMRIEPADGGAAIAPKDKTGAGNQIAFLAVKDADYVAVAMGDPKAGLKPFTMNIRRWDESEPLPASLQFAAPPLAVPKVAVIDDVKDKLLVGAAFAPDSKSFWTSQHDMTLTLWHYPAIEKKGTYKLKERLYALAVDGKGRLYAQPGPADTANPLLARRSVGDLVVYADLNPKGDADELPRPAGRILVGGLVGRMICSKDGRAIFFLDVKNGKVGRIDTENLGVSASVDDLSEGTIAFCLTPDGKKIYCCADTGHIDIIDVASFKLEHTVELHRGNLFEIAATDKGIVFVLGQDIAPAAAGPGNLGLVDLSRGLPKKAFVVPVPIGHHGQYLQLAPEQDAVFVAGNRRITTCVPPPRPALQRAVCAEFQLRDLLTPGWLQISPDGRTILHDIGSILSVRR